MANTEGILFADLFISDKELFVNFFTEYYQENKAIIDPVINSLNSVLQKYLTQQLTEAMAEEFSSAWRNFQKIVLLNNKNLQLLVSYRGYRGRNATFSQIVDQEKVEGVDKGTYGIKTGDNLIKDSMATLNASKIEKFLQSHLNGMLNQLDTSLTSYDAYLLHKYHTKTLAEYYQKHDEAHLTGLKFRNVFYGSNDNSYFAGQGLGQVYDAFFNHLANHEKQIFDYLTANGKNPHSVSNFGDLRENNHSVYKQENEIGKTGNFPNLINESKNHIGWYTGGDIIIVNPQTMNIVYNIQLKTTTLKNTTVFTEKIQSLRNFIESFIKLTPREKSEKLFNFLLTSVSNANEFNKIPQDEANMIIKETLLQKSKNVQITMITETF